MQQILNLKNKVAIITGAGTGIGEAIAMKFASLGASVVCAGLPQDPVEDVAKAIRRARGKAAAFEADLGDPKNAQACVDFALKIFKKIDIVVNNAGVVLVADEADSISDEASMRTIHSNIDTMFFMTRAALPHLKKSRGVLLATSSVAGLKGEPGNVIYGGTKGFINSFMQGLAVEQAQHGVRVNCVLPGVIDTAMTRASRTLMSKKDERTMTDDIPMQRRGTPEEIANAFAFLASDLSTYTTGALMVVDGGYSTGWGGVDDVPAALKVKPKGSLDRTLKHSHAGGLKKNNPAPKH